MRRLRKVSEDANNINDVKNLIAKIDKATDDLKDIYYVLFNNLNILYEAYPTLYKQIEMVVKLPTNNDAEDVVQFYNDLHGILQHLQDDKYLSSYINPQPDPTNTQDLGNEQNSEQTDSLSE